MAETPTFGRYAEIPYDQMTPEQQEGYRSLIETRGRLPGPNKIYIHNPKLAAVMGPLISASHARRARGSSRSGSPRSPLSLSAIASSPASCARASQLPAPKAQKPSSSRDFCHDQLVITLLRVISLFAQPDGGCPHSSSRKSPTSSIGRWSIHIQADVVRLMLRPTDDGHRPGRATEAKACHRSHFPSMCLVHEWPPIQAACVNQFQIER